MARQMNPQVDIIKWCIFLKKLRYSIGLTA
jgi:hypothetical protein